MAGYRLSSGNKRIEKIWKINEAITLDILQVPNDEIKVTHAYKSKYNHTRKNQLVLLTITDGEKWHYTALKSEPTEDGFNRPTKSLCRLFRGKISKHDGDWIAWIVYIDLEQIMHLKTWKIVWK